MEREERLENLRKCIKIVNDATSEEISTTNEFSEECEQFMFTAPSELDN